MLISLNWLRDFVDIPSDADPAALAERFTLICAEVEGVERIHVAADGLIAAKIVSHERVAPRLHSAMLDIGDGKTVETVSAAQMLRDGGMVVYAPPGASTKATGRIDRTTVGGVQSTGMILSGQNLGIALAAEDAVYCPPGTNPGDAIDPAPFEDWVIEVDNKSITHRPDLWGHYGIAREIAAILGSALKPYPVVDAADLSSRSLPEIPIDIQQPDRCPRYSGLMISGVGFQASPLWMQLRLGHVGMRPIDALVDLTNYIMAELGQPMHAFDGDKVERIEVGFTQADATFTTLDGIERKLPAQALMIQSSGQPVALAGVMGGLETEVSAGTKNLLLESANFEAAGIRRTATALGLRTEASARFEKSLDPQHTTLAIQRFVKLGREQFPDLKLTSRLSDCYPNPLTPQPIEIDPAFVDRYMGEQVPVERIESILTAIEFDVKRDVIGDGAKLLVTPPSFRATKDVSIEADVIEEIARYVGYDNIAESMPRMSLRYFAPNTEHRLERDSLRMLCIGLGYSELHLYIWYDAAWCRRLGLESVETVRLRNPVSPDQQQLREWLIPGMLQAADRNRLHADRFKNCEVGSVFPTTGDEKESRRLGLVLAARGKAIEDDLLLELKGDLETWCWQVLGVPVTFEDRAENDGPPRWAHESKAARVSIAGRRIGWISPVPLAVRRGMDEHLAAWGMAWAEIELDPLQEVQPADFKLRRVPEHPEVELDFSVLAPKSSRFAALNEKLGGFDHELLRRINFVEAYEGKAIGADQRSLTYRVRIGAADRTLVDQDVASFREAFEKHVQMCGLELRR